MISAIGRNLPHPLLQGYITKHRRLLLVFATHISVLIPSPALSSVVRMKVRRENLFRSFIESLSPSMRIA
jgi:hypothetical protein